MSSAEIFEKMFSKKPDRTFWSPGRVCIIGEHTDYHDGYVMPAAIDLGFTWFIAKNGNFVEGYSEKFDEIGKFDIRKSERTKYEWMLYLQGVVETLKKRKKSFSAINFAIHSTLPIGSGLSSSSSLATGFTYILNEINHLGLSRPEIAKVACEAEWWYGTTGGIMDQYCIANGKKANAVLLDCRKLEHEYIKLPDDIKMVIFETTIRHKQIDSPFDLRKRQAGKAVDVAKGYFKDKKITALRDLTFDMLKEIKPKLVEQYGKKEGEIIFRRSKHPILENARVFEMKDAFTRNDKAMIGKILYECHTSLRDDYEVSCPELDAAVEVAKNINGIIGSRMVGGGYGGCTLNLVQAGSAQHFAGELEELFRKETGIKGNAYICHASDGVEELK